MEVQFDGLSSDEESLPKISFGSFSSQPCKREPGVIGSTSSGSEQSRRSPPSDPRLASNWVKSRPLQVNGEKNGTTATAGHGERSRASEGGGPIRRRARGKRSRSTCAGNPGNCVYNVKFEIRSKTVKNFLGSATDADETDEEAYDEDGQQAENGGSVAAH